MKIAIHQPNFIPWIPWFEKMQAADIFVYLTSCQYEKGGYQNRFWYNNMWNTMRVKHGMCKIINKEYVDANMDFDALCLRYPILKRYSELITNNILASTNIKLSNAIAKDINIETRIENDLDIFGTSTERLVRICKKFKCNEYISGISGPKYMDMELFKKNGIKVTIFEPSDSRHILEVLK